MELRNKKYIEKYNILSKNTVYFDNLISSLKLITRYLLTDQNLIEYINKIKVVKSTDRKHITSAFFCISCI